METLSITNDKGRNFRVQIVYKGERYGYHKCLAHTEDEPLVEFYDLSYPDTFGAEGQFVSRYYLGTLREHGYGVDLDLQGDVPAWKIDGLTMCKVLKWFGPRP